MSIGRKEMKNYIKIEVKLLLLKIVHVASQVTSIKLTPSSPNEKSPTIK